MKNTMNATPLLLLLTALSVPVLNLKSDPVTEKDGDWAAKSAVLPNTPEALLMVRTGDIDNLGFGWPAQFDPFSGNSTPGHGFPWAYPADDPQGTDRIMVISSYAGTPPFGSDGYSTTTARPDNTPKPIKLEFVPPNTPITRAVFQVFVDDFQAPVWGASYTVTLNGQRFPQMEAVINSLEQTGPIGKLITVAVPGELLGQVSSGFVELFFDDTTTGAGDGYAIDFVKLLLNPTGEFQTGAIKGTVTDAASGLALANATVKSFDSEALTDANGFYQLNNVPSGLAFVSASAPGYEPKSVNVDVVTGQTTENVNFALARSPFTLKIYTAVELEFFGNAGVKYVLQYSGDLKTWQDEETITGQGDWVYRLRSTRSPDQKYWRAEAR